MDKSGSLYNKERLSSIYIHTADVHNMTAPREVVPVIIKLYNPGSVLDVGCGTGTWLKAFEEAGVNEYLGIDGAYVNTAQLEIPKENFKAVDLRNAWNLNRRFDLVISLEVAEHLPEASAAEFVEALTRHSGTIIFSAAIPGQGGQYHINEQWPAYWEKKFAVHGFYFHDVLRPLLWDNPNVDWWYRQNIFLVNREKSIVPVRPMVHPECFSQRVQTGNAATEKILRGESGVLNAVKILVRSIKNIF